MKIGIISDTHDNVDNILKAVSVFKQEGVSYVVHCGDIVAPATLKHFKGIRLKLVLGNCDGDIQMIKKVCEEMSFEFLGTYSEFSESGKTFFVMHKPPDEYAPEKIGSYDYILHGHTHKKRDEHIKGTHIINPGAHYWHSEGTIAILDIPEDKVKFVKL